MSRTLLAAACLSIALVGALPSAQTQVEVPHPVPEVAAGFTIAPLSPVAGATAIAFGPGVGGQDLYATTLTGDVTRIHLLWTAAGPVANGLSTFRSGLSGPLGIVFDGGAAYVADSHGNPATGRTDGRVLRIEADGTVGTVVDGLPNGRHNTNHLRFGPDGRLFIANGNPNDNGVDGGDPDVFPYSGAILAVDTANVTPSSPAVLEWTDGSGNVIAPGSIASHAANADFAAAVDVVGSGFRNVFGVAFGPDGSAYTAMNGADTPASQDALFHIADGADYGYPFCFNEGLPGATGGGVSVVANPTFPGHDCTGVPPATALLGWHTCTTGIDFPTSGPFAFPAGMANSAFVAECVAFQPDDVAAKSLDEGVGLHTTHSTSHKVVRVALDSSGEATEVKDFVTGLALATDVLFGPDGALYIADAEMVYRVAPLGAVNAAQPLPTVGDALPVLPGVGPVEPPSFAIQAAGFSFAPAVAVVPLGTEVRWEGRLLGHTVDTADSLEQARAAQGNDATNSDGNPDTFSHPLPQGGALAHTFTAPGTYYYFCQPHAGLGMVGVVIVAGSPSLSVVTAGDPLA
jgi:glucose/arabinose dehydrogenase/plastocyanin